ncbi:TonB-dependent receptor [Novosphingobium umbonatum]|uniref:TonB-dependent receptor n=1 Tax=Novosphingobium umbonatum TaxID=1908524 RepID=A0A3S2VGT6_9SPHN|nr:TonB-dependent receptor [Novosphingobium umbonatum]RVU07909.1 TonB-dependent receptor [Novosphingobium umbonatum]
MIPRYLSVFLFSTALTPMAHAQITPQNAAPKAEDVVTTGVAKGRDRLDSATSTSSLREADIIKLGARSVGELLRAMPGVFSEAPNGESIANISIRGLPVVSSGAKFVQLQEDGLPVVEFGDIIGGSADTFIRADLNLMQVESIRGGSASTFASNSPGGIINFISKTGDLTGGAIALTSGVNFQQYRADFDYGARLSDDWRFHVGGFWRQGNGPRNVGFESQRGGQMKFNITREFTGGHVRVYAKVLDDRSPFYDSVPLKVTGSNDSPALVPVAGFNPGRGTLSSVYLQSAPMLDENNNIVSEDLRQGQRVKEKSIGVEGQIDVDGWTITDRFRIANRSGGMYGPFSSVLYSGAAGLTRLGGAGATLSYASGPRAGQVIADPSSLNGNGLIAVINIRIRPQEDLGSMVNDLRASKIYEVAKGKLTTTGGFYASRQAIHTALRWAEAVTEVRGDGQAALLNITNAAGQAVTQNGFYAFNYALNNGTQRRTMSVDYAVQAAYGSVNFHRGKVAVGGSLRYDFGSASGQVFGSDLGGGRVGTVSRDMNGDGVISLAEQKVGITPLGSPAPVNYSYHYLSYSAGINYRVAEPFSVFARYSRGARANADRILYTAAINNADGSLAIPQAAYDPVKQAELGMKFRKSNLTVNLTGFSVNSQDTNVNTGTGVVIARKYKAKGLEFEAGYRRGLFSVNGGATYTDAKIVDDYIDASVIGKHPRHLANLIFQVTPQINWNRVNFGATFIGTTDSYAQDSNILKMPGYVTTNAFIQARVTPRMQVTLNAANLFDVLALTAIDEAGTPANGIVRGRLPTGRTVSASLRLDL